MRQLESKEKLPIQQTDNLLTIKEIASYLGVSKQSLYRVVKSSAILAYRVGGTWHLRLSETEESLHRVFGKCGMRS